ncbi:MAG: DUF1853 family protein [Flavobacteriales bacterium]
MAWVIGSTPLMSFSPKSEAYQKLTSSWFENELNRCMPLLKKLDSDPIELQKFVDSESRQLLGKRFELFIEYWLRHSGAYEVVLSNVQVKKELRTIGELDYVLKHLESGEVWHFEVACKYYLGFKNSALWTNWLGINAKDSLGDKMSKFDRQLSIFQTPEGQQLLDRERLTLPKSFLLMKGFFFYEWTTLKKAKAPKQSNKGHNTGLFVKSSDIPAFFSADNSWVILNKQHWFSRYSSTDTLEVYSELAVIDRVREILAQYNFGVMLARLNSHSPVPLEDLRVVVVPDAWPSH